MSKVQFLDQLLRDFKQINESTVVSKDNDKHLPILTNNKNRLKMKEYVKKLQHYKSELNNKLNSVELSYTNFKEQRLSMSTIINRELGKMQKVDEDNIKETLNSIKKLLEFDQRLMIEIETVFENQQTITQQELEAASHAFSELETQVHSVKRKECELTCLDFKILSLKEYNRLMALHQEQQLQENDSQFFKNEQKINIRLTEQMDQKNAQIEELKNQLQEYENHIEQQSAYFNAPPPQTFSFIDQTNNLFDHIHKLMQSFSEELKENEQRFQELLNQNENLRQQVLTQSEYIYELKNLNQRAESDSKHREDQYKRKIDDSRQILEEKIRLQNEVTNLLNTSIEIEKENSQFTSVLQQQAHQIKQLQKQNGQLYKELQQYKEDRQKINEELEQSVQIQQRCRDLNKQLENIEKQNQELNQRNNILQVEFDSYKAQSDVKLKQLNNEILCLSGNGTQQVEFYKNQLEEQQKMITQLNQSILDLQKNVNNYKEDLLEQKQQHYEQIKQKDQQIQQIKKEIELQTNNNIQQIQQEYTELLQEQQDQMNTLQQEIEELKQKNNMLKRQLDQMEFIKEQEIMKNKLESDKKSFQHSKQIELLQEQITQSISYKQLKDLENHYQLQIQQIQEETDLQLKQTQEKYEHMIQDLISQYEKQIQYLQEQINFQKQIDTQTRFSSKPPRAQQQKSPQMYTNSPASSIQQSFYREVAKFSKDLDESQDDQKPRKSGGICKQNRHIFIEDLSQSNIQSEPTVQNYSTGEQIIRQEQAIQTEEVNEDIFPPFDRRICLRCKKNDMIAPHFCKFKEVNQLSDSQVKMKQSRVLREHVYGSNLSWRQKDPYSAQKSNYFSTFERVTQGMNTILSLVNDNLIKKTQKSQSSIRKNRNSDSLNISFSSNTNRSQQ